MRVMVSATFRVPIGDSFDDYCTLRDAMASMLFGRGASQTHPPDSS